MSVRSLLQGLQERLRQDHVIHGPIRLQEEDPGSRCKPVLITKDAPIYLLLCEFKSGSGASMPQIENTRMIADYLLQMASYHEERGMPEIHRRAITFRSGISRVKPRFQHTRCPWERHTGRQSDLLLVNLAAGSEYPLSWFTAP
jgi:hypothetical protein